MLEALCEPVFDECLVGNGFHRGELLDGHDLKWIKLDRYVLQISLTLA
jgi:hypothetical protein